MNPLPLVTIGVRSLGLILVLWHAGSIGQFVAIILAYMVGRLPFDLVGFLLDPSGGGIPESVNLGLFVLGLYLFLSGRWVIARLTRGLVWSGGGTCPKCGYDVSAVESARCPECGTKLPTAKDRG